jgi:hypothetical protein
VALKTDASELAGYAVQAIAADYPTGRYLVAIAVALDVRDNAIPWSDGQPDEAGGSMDLASVLMERTGQDGLCGLLRKADIEGVNAAAASQVYGPEEFTVRTNLDHPLSAPGSEKLLD